MQDRPPGFATEAPTATGPVCRCRMGWLPPLIAAVVLMLGLLMPAAVPAVLALEPARGVPAAAPAVEHLRIGAFLTGLSDFDPARKSFSASFWIWGVGSADTLASFNNLEFPNAIKVESPNALSETTPQGIWSQRKIVGTFRHGWDLRRFPFDRQLLRIQMEEAVQDASRLVYVADTANSSFDAEVQLAGWRLRSATLVASRKPYRSSFGDPRLQPGAPSAYARAELQLLLERTDRSGFWKLTAGAFASALMALASFGLRIDQPSALGPRFGLLAGSTFAAVISLRSAATELGASGYTTLIDAVHVAVLAYILTATAAGVLAWRRFLRHEDPLRAQRLERRLAGVATLALGVVILAMVLGAMASGPV